MNGPGPETSNLLCVYLLDVYFEPKPTAFYGNVNPKDGRIHEVFG